MKSPDDKSFQLSLRNSQGNGQQHNGITGFADFRVPISDHIESTVHTAPGFLSRLIHPLSATRFSIPKRRAATAIHAPVLMASLTNAGKPRKSFTNFSRSVTKL